MAAHTDTAKSDVGDGVDDLLLSLTDAAGSPFPVDPANISVLTSGAEYYNSIKVY